MKLRDKIEITADLKGFNIIFILKIVEAECSKLYANFVSRVVTKTCKFCIKT